MYFYMAAPFKVFKNENMLYLCVVFPYPTGSHKHTIIKNE